MLQIFPDGLQEVTKAYFDSVKPLKGCRVNSTSSMARMLGLRPGDVILAIEGKRVENFKQYQMLMSSTLDPHTRIIYRHGKQVTEIDCQLPERRLFVDMSDIEK